MTINDLAFALVKNKDDKQTIKNWEKKIESWEKEKAYPTLDEIYQMAYIINLNPGELLAIRNRGRKQFYRESDDPPHKKKVWVELDENTTLVFIGLARLFGIFAIFGFCIVFAKFMDTFYGGTGAIIEDQVLERQIKQSTGRENEIVDDGSVENMVRRIKRENNGYYSENEISNEIED
ncbi:MAG: hypothetical protein IJ629_06595 [Clostridia bacterium]|nr:hypothetical protein [Clostridia bacterium]